MENRKNPIIICRVTRPELTPEERERRMAEIKKAATAFLVAVELNNARARTSGTDNLSAC